MGISGQDSQEHPTSIQPTTDTDMGNSSSFKTCVFLVLLLPVPPKESLTKLDRIGFGKAAQASVKVPAAVK